MKRSRQSDELLRLTMRASVQVLRNVIEQRWPKEYRCAQKVYFAFLEALQDDAPSTGD
jgi:hypothetical protein